MNWKVGEMVRFQKDDLYLHRCENLFEVLEYKGNNECTLRAADDRCIFTNQRMAGLRRVSPLELLALVAE